MSRKIAVTGIGVINDLCKGPDHFNQILYDGLVGRCSPEQENSENVIIENLIECAKNDVRSTVFKKGLENGLDKTAIVRIADNVSSTEKSFDFEKSFTRPDLLTALESAVLLLDAGSITCVMVVSFAGAIVLRAFDRAVSQNDRIYAVIDTTLSAEDNGEHNKISISEDIGFLTICCENLKSLTLEKLKKLSALTPFRDKENRVAGIAFDPMAGLITTLLCIYNRYYPGQKSFDIPCDIMESSPFYFPFSSHTWFKGKKGQPRRAVLCSIRKSHEYYIFLSEAGLEKPVHSVYLSHSLPRLFPVAAFSKKDLGEKLEALSIKAGQSFDLKKLTQENYLDYKSIENKAFVAVVSGDSSSAIKREIGFLTSGFDRSFGNGNSIKTPGGSYFTPRPLGEKGKIVFVYPGVGSAYTGLGQDLFQMFPNVYDFFSTMAPDVGGFVKEKELYPRVGKKLSKEELKQYDKTLRKNIMEISQCGMSFSVIYTMILGGVFKLFPEYALGYSMGEASMMASLMVWENPAELSSKLKENDAFTRALGGNLTAVREAWDISPNSEGEIWESYTLLADRKKVENLVSQEERVYLTLVNTDNELVIAGDPEKCLQVIKKLGCKYFPLKLALAIHSKPAYLAYDRLVDLYSLTLNPPSGIKLYSSSCYLPVPLRTKSIANSIAKAFCDTVDFPRLVRKVYDDGGRIFIEAGPRQTCSVWIDDILAKKQFLTIPLNIKGVRDQVSMARAVSMLMSHNVNMDAESLYKF